MRGDEGRCGCEKVWREAGKSVLGVRENEGRCGEMRGLV